MAYDEKSTSLVRLSAQTPKPVLQYASPEGPPTPIPTVNMFSPDANLPAAFTTTHLKLANSAAEMLWFTGDAAAAVEYNSDVNPLHDTTYNIDVNINGV